MAAPSCNVRRSPPFRRPHPRNLLLVVAWLAVLGPLVAVAAPPPNKSPLSDTERKKLVVERDRLWKESHDLQAQQKLPEAIAAAEKTLAIDRQLFGNVHEELTGPLNWLSDCHVEREDFKAARRVGEELLSIQTKLHGAENWKTGDARRQLELNVLLERLTRDQRRLLDRATRLMDHVREQLDAGNYPESLRAVQEARTIRANVLGEDHWVTGYSTAWLGTVYDHLEDAPRAEEAYRQAMLNRRQCLGENHPSYATALDNLANAYSARGDFAKAAALSRQSVAIRKAAFGEKDLTYALGLHNLANEVQVTGQTVDIAPCVSVEQLGRQQFGEPGVVLFQETADSLTFQLQEGVF